MKTAELQGCALDWAVAKANQAVGLIKSDPMLDCLHYFTPSTNWSQGGPIIEREKIDLNHYRMPDLTAMWDASIDSWETDYAGTTPLIAAMRCFVASKLGDTVDIPEELT